jgi:hypothetical protein
MPQAGNAHEVYFRIGGEPNMTFVLREPGSLFECLASPGVLRNDSGHPVSAEQIISLLKSAKDNDQTWNQFGRILVYNGVQEDQLAAARAELTEKLDNPDQFKSFNVDKVALLLVSHLTGIVVRVYKDSANAFRNQRGGGLEEELNTWKLLQTTYDRHPETKRNGRVTEWQTGWIVLYFHKKGEPISPDFPCKRVFTGRWKRDFRTLMISDY